MTVAPIHLFDNFYSYPVGQPIPSGYMSVGEVGQSGEESLCSGMPDGSSKWQEGFKSLVIKGSSGGCYTTGGGGAVLLQKAPVFVFSKVPYNYYISTDDEGVPEGYKRETVSGTKLQVGVATNPAECNGALPGEPTRKVWGDRIYWVMPGADGRCYSSENKTTDLLYREAPAFIHLYGSYYAINEAGFIRNEFKFKREGTVGRTDPAWCSGVPKGSMVGDVINAIDGACYSTDPAKQREVIIQGGKPTIERAFWTLGRRDDLGGYEGYDPSLYRFNWGLGTGSLSLGLTARTGYASRFGSRQQLFDGAIGLARESHEAGYATAGARLLYMRGPFGLKLDAEFGGSSSPTDLHPFPTFRLSGPIVNNGDTLSLTSQRSSQVDNYFVYDVSLDSRVRIGRPDHIAALDIYGRAWARSGEVAPGLYPSRFGGCVGLNMVREKFPYGASFEACGMDREEVAGGDGGALQFTFGWDLYRNPNLRIFAGITETKTFGSFFNQQTAGLTTDLDGLNYSTTKYWAGADWQKRFGKTYRLSLGGKVGAYSIRADLPDSETVFVTDGSKLGQIRNPYAQISDRGKPFGHASPFIDFAAKACFNIKGYTLCPTLQVGYNYQNFWGSSHDFWTNFALQFNLEKGTVEK
jgi:hypothetical protein